MLKMSENIQPSQSKGGISEDEEKEELPICALLAKNAQFVVERRTKLCVSSGSHSNSSLINQKFYGFVIAPKP